MTLQINNLNTVQNYSLPKTNSTFKANSVIVSNTLERSSNNDILVKQPQNKTNKTLLTIGEIILACAGIFGGIKLGKIHQQKKTIQEIEKKFTDLQNDIPRVQKTFKEVFLRDNLTEKETREMLNRYKEIEKLGVTGKKEEYIQALYKEANSNYGIKPIKLMIEAPEKVTVGGRTSPINEYISINPNRAIDEYWDIIHHELRHAKQHILGYNQNQELARQAIFTKSIFNVDMQPRIEQSIDKLIDEGMTVNKIQKTLSEKYKAELDEILSKNFGELNPDNVPESQKELAQKLIKSMSERDNIKYITDYDYYKNSFFEIDARSAGESIAELFNKPHYC